MLFRPSDSCLFLLFSGEMKKAGAGKGNWGTESDVDIAPG